MNVISEKKKSLRAEMLMKRDQMNSLEKESADRFFCEEILDLSSSFEVIHLYLPIRSEPDIYPLITSLLEMGKTLVAPETLRNHKMIHRPLRNVESVSKGLYGTFYPNTDEVYQGKIDLILVPGLAFSVSGRRLGYGGGYYDGFLKHHPEAMKVALSYDFQYLEHVPYVAHDATVDRVVCYRP